MFLLFLCLISIEVSFSVVDRTREDRAVGADIVQAVVDLIRDNCIYPNDRVFLRRLAYVESRDGRNLNTFRPNFYGGIWQVEESDFNSTKHNPLLVEQYMKIQEELKIAWENVRWRDLTKPLYSGLAASLVLRTKVGDNTPGVLEKQAEYWMNNYHADKSSDYFISQIQNIPVEDCQIDIGFILDESGSIGNRNFQTMLGFVKNVTDKFVIGPQAVEVAVVTFDSYASTAFGFGSYTSHANLHRAIDDVSYKGGGTNTAEGIRLARESVFRNGARRSSTKVGLVITDGCSNDYSASIQEAQYAKRKDGIVLFALGIGGICMNELEAIASQPSCTHVFFLTGFSDIDSLIHEIRKAACRAPIIIDPHQPVISGNNGTTTATPTFHNYTITQTLSTNKTETKTVAVPTNNAANDTDGESIMQLTVNCGIVHVYMSYDHPHPSSVLYSNKLTATDGHPAVLFLNKTVDGRPLYMTYVGTRLPSDAADLKNCRDAHYEMTFTYVNKSGLEIICRQNGQERECTKLDFQLHKKYKDYLCSSPAGVKEAPVPNPCTMEVVQNNELFHPHPYDNTKFITCGHQQHKMYITQCPQGERYFQGSHSCGTTTTIMTGDKIPLDPDLINPCTAQAVANQEFFFPYSRDNSKFIYCDVWRHAWVMPCPPTLVWGQKIHACIENLHRSSNPCTHDQVDRAITMFPHPDPHKYIHCDTGLTPWVQSCAGGTVFDFTTQNCVWENLFD